MKTLFYIPIMYMNVMISSISLSFPGGAPRSRILSMSGHGTPLKVKTFSYSPDQIYRILNMANHTLRKNGSTYDFNVKRFLNCPLGSTGGGGTRIRK